MSGRGKCLVVCGPTASGKSGFVDLVSEEFGARTMLVDSMQVYREIPVISNQRRDRPASLCGVTSVSGEWSVAKHRDAVLHEMESSGGRTIIDAGTGMYLNAILLDLPLAPKAPPDVRAEAESAARVTSGVNPRRLSRELELRAMQSGERRSVWDGELRFETYVIYLRPDRPVLDRRIEARSRAIVENGLPEAEALLDKKLSPTVRDAIGVREMLLYATGQATADEAAERISTRTRQLSRRQMRWFDKLLNVLRPAIHSITLDNTTGDDFLSPRQIRDKNCIHDIIRAWKD